jgi:hypothetical protein
LELHGLLAPRTLTKPTGIRQAKNAGDSGVTPENGAALILFSAFVRFQLRQ